MNKIGARREFVEMQTAQSVILLGYKYWTAIQNVSQPCRLKSPVCSTTDDTSTVVLVREECRRSNNKHAKIRKMKLLRTLKAIPL